MGNAPPSSIFVETMHLRVRKVSDIGYLRED